MRNLANKLTQNGYECSKDTIHCHLANDLGVRAYTGRKKLKITKMQKKMRIGACKQRLKWTSKD